LGKIFSSLPGYKAGVIEPDMEVISSLQDKIIRLSRLVLPVVKNDRDRISQVIINLLGNALKYTPSEGVIKVEAVSK